MQFLIENIVLVAVAVVSGLMLAWPALQRGTLTFLDTESPAVLAFWRATATDRLLCLFNLSEQPHSLSLDLSAFHGRALVDLLTETEPWRVGDLVGFGVGHPCTTFDKWPLLHTVDDGYRVLRVSDGFVLPVVSALEEDRRERKRSMWWV